MNIVQTNNYKIVIQKLWEEHLQEVQVYSSNPSAFPDYDKDLLTFVKKRSGVIASLGANVEIYDFKKEFDTIWLLKGINVMNKKWLEKEKLCKKTCMKLQDMNSSQLLREIYTQIGIERLQSNCMAFEEPNSVRDCRTVSSIWSESSIFRSNSPSYGHQSRTNYSEYEIDSKASSISSVSDYNRCKNKEEKPKHFNDASPCKHSRSSSKHSRLSRKHSRTSRKHSKLSRKHSRTSRKHPRISRKHPTSSSSSNHSKTSSKHSRLSRKHSRTSRKHSTSSSSNHSKTSRKHSRTYSKHSRSPSKFRKYSKSHMKHSILPSRTHMKYSVDSGKRSRESSSEKYHRKKNKMYSPSTASDSSLRCHEIRKCSKFKVLDSTIHDCKSKKEHRKSRTPKNVQDKKIMDFHTEFSRSVKTSSKPTISVSEKFKNYSSSHAIEEYEIKHHIKKILRSISELNVVKDSQINQTAKNTAKVPNDEKVEAFSGLITPELRLSSSSQSRLIKIISDTSDSKQKMEVPCVLPDKGTGCKSLLLTLDSNDVIPSDKAKLNDAFNRNRDTHPCAYENNKQWDFFTPYKELLFFLKQNLDDDVLGIYSPVVDAMLLEANEMEIKSLPLSLRKDQRLVLLLILDKLRIAADTSSLSFCDEDRISCRYTMDKIEGFVSKYSGELDGACYPNFYYGHDVNKLFQKSLYRSETECINFVNCILLHDGISIKMETLEVLCKKLQTL